MADSLNLETGDLAEAERIAAAGAERSKRVRRTRSTGEKSTGSTSGKTAPNLVARLVDAFDRLATQLEARGDEELADAFRKDGRAMAHGLDSLTRTVTFLRLPLVFAISFLEPVLAFWHVGGILVGRFIARRQRVMAERDAAAAASAYEDPNLAPVA